MGALSPFDRHLVSAIEKSNKNVTQPRWIVSTEPAAKIKKSPLLIVKTVGNKSKYIQQ